MLVELFNITNKIKYSYDTLDQIGDLNGVHSVEYRELMLSIKKLVETEEVLLEEIKTKELVKTFYERTKDFSRINPISIILNDVKDLEFFRIASRLLKLVDSYEEDKRRDLKHYLRMDDINRYLLLLLEDGLKISGNDKNVLKNIRSIKNKVTFLNPVLEKELLSNGFKLKRPIYFDSDLIRGCSDDCFENKHELVVPNMINDIMKYFDSVKDVNINNNSKVFAKSVYCVSVLRAITPFMSDRNIELLKKLHGINYLKNGGNVINSIVDEYIDRRINVGFCDDRVIRVIPNKMLTKELEKRIKERL